MTHPELLLQYLDFCRHRESGDKFGRIILQDESYPNPTTALPLYELSLKNPKLSFQFTMDESADDGKKISFSEISDPHVIEIPLNASASDAAFQIVSNRTNANDFGGSDAFVYVLAELTDNVYEHSHFSRGSIMTRSYYDRGFCDLGIFDNGVSIRKSFSDHGMRFSQDSEAIVWAINGLSSKKDLERGHGLGSTIRIFLEALRGQVFIVSGSGAVFLEGTSHVRYDITSKNVLEGTLITVRAPYPSEQVDIYKYVE